MEFTLSHLYIHIYIYRIIKLFSTVSSFHTCLLLQCDSLIKLSSSIPKQSYNRLTGLKTLIVVYLVKRCPVWRPRGQLSNARWLKQTVEINGGRYFWPCQFKSGLQVDKVLAVLIKYIHPMPEFLSTSRTCMTFTCIQVEIWTLSHASLQFYFLFDTLVPDKQNNR